MDLIALLRQPNVTLVDVRETYEFAMGHAAGAINIPLSSLMRRLPEFKKMKGPVVVYCRSGSRSGQARQILLANGLREVYNAGGLADVQYVQKQAARQSY